MEQQLSTKGFLETLVQGEPNNAERGNTLSEFLLRDFHSIVGNKGFVMGQKVHGRFADGADARYNVWFEVENDQEDGSSAHDECLLLYGHFDVTDADKKYDLVRHERKPNELFEHPDEPNLVYGLGSEDMLGGIAAIRQAVQSIVKNMDKGSLWPPRKIRGIFTYGEEGWSPGFAAAQEQGLFQSVDLCITPEILVNKIPLTMRRAVGYGRVGRYGFKVMCRGLSCHFGAHKEHRGQLTETLMDRAKAFFYQKLEPSLRPHANPQGIFPEPSLGVKATIMPGVSSLSTSDEGSHEMHVFFANREESLSEIIGRVRQGLTAIAREIFPNDSDPEEVRLREHAFEVIPERHPFEFAMPYKDDAFHPFHENVRRYVYDAFKKFGDPAWEAPMEETVQKIVDSGVADCGRIAALGIPVAGIYPLGGRGGDPKHPVFSGGDAHKYIERLWLPSINELAHVIERAAAAPHFLTQAHL